MGRQRCRARGVPGPGPPRPGPPAELGPGDRVEPAGLPVSLGAGSIGPVARLLELALRRTLRRPDRDHVLVSGPANDRLLLTLDHRDRLPRGRGELDRGAGRHAARAVVPLALWGRLGSRCG